LALLLAQQGRSVVLLEGSEIGSGSTGNSTGNLYVTVSDGLHSLASKWGADVARQVVLQRAAAIDFIEAQAATEPAAAFRRCPLMRWAKTAQDQPQLEQEYRALSAAGCNVRWEKDVPAGLPVALWPALVLEGQAQFQPQSYVALLARRAAQAGASVHEHSRVLSLDLASKVATTATGAVRAGEIVLATHTPAGLHGVHAEMPVHREYGVALPLPAVHPGPGIYWWQGSEGLSIRTLEHDGQQFLVCIGQEHKTGDHNAKAGLMAVEALARRHFGDAEVAYRWSAQNYRPADGLPYIGRDITGAYVATGFATDGLTWGTVSAQVIAAQLAGESPAFGDLCRASRFSPIKGAKALIEENFTTVKALVKDYLSDRQEEELTGLAAGDSALVDVDGDSVAAFRAPDGELFAVSPVCTHMGCKVHWNSVETSWDCPCHGSRFRPDGTVIEGPALQPLARKHLKLGTA
jgi:glycine/D-amino acid oxidase-like deaminating enzyme/nitrite reductase/ring-hydroxylating ferredoxin subunit